MSVDRAGVGTDSPLACGGELSTPRAATGLTEKGSELTPAGAGRECDGDPPSIDRRSGLGPGLMRRALGRSPGDSAPLVVVRDGLSGPPVIVVGLCEPVECLRQGPASDRPLWWLKLDGLYGPPAAIRPIAEMAARFALEIGDHWPDGPLTLVGYSFGGLVAIELAHRLQRAGCSPMVLALEPPLPGIMPTRAKRRHGAVLIPPSLAQSSTRWRRIMRGVDVTDSPIGMPARVMSWASRLYRERLLRPHLDKLSARDGGIPRRHRQWWYYHPQVHDRVMSYEAPPYHGPVHLVGRPDWLAKYEATWNVLLEVGGSIPCPLPLACDHNKVATLPAARPWMDLIAAGSPTG